MLYIAPSILRKVIGFWLTYGWVVGWVDLQGIYVSVYQQSSGNVLLGVFGVVQGRLYEVLMNGKTYALKMLRYQKKCDYTPISTKMFYSKFYLEYYYTTLVHIN